MHEVQAFARRNGAVFVIDETQSAFGRAGSWFAFEGFDLRPDLVVAGKGISSSLPLTIMLGRAEVVDAAPAKALSSTHGGNPMACRAACEVLEILESEQPLDNSRELGATCSLIRDGAARAGLEVDARGRAWIGVAILDGARALAPARARAWSSRHRPRPVVLARRPPQERRPDQPAARSSPAIRRRRASRS